MRRTSVVAVVFVLAAVLPAGAQGFKAAASRPRPWSRVSFYTNTFRTSVAGLEPRLLSETITAFSYQLPDIDEDGADYGIDTRYSNFMQGTRPARTSIYEGFVGARLAGGRLRARVGHLWLQDVGALGSIAGGSVEFRQHRTDDTDGRFRIGAFAGLEPNVLDTGYAAHVRKIGGFVAWDGNGANRSSLGYVAIRNGTLMERSVLTTTNFLSLRRKVYVYQAAEVNLEAPSGVAHTGLSYLFTNARVTPTSRFELQATYNRGRSIDARGLVDDVLSGRPIVQSAIDGLLYESAGGRITVEVVPRTRLYVGLSRDKNNRDTAATRRLQVGGYASNVRPFSLDISASDSLMDRPTGSYHSTYLSLGRQLGRRLYLTGDYSTSLSVIRFSRSDGLVIETRPHTTRMSGTMTASMSRAWSLMTTVERTAETGLQELRGLAGLTYRIR